MADAPDRRRTAHRLLRGMTWRPKLRLSIRWSTGGSWRPHFRKRPYARPALSYLTDARTVLDPLQVRGIPPEEGRRARLRLGSIVAGLAAVFVLGFVVSIFGTHGYRDVRESRRMLADLEAKLEAQEDKVTPLRRQVQRLKEEPAAIERIAREELGFARPGEITFLLPKGDGDEAVGRSVPIRAREAGAEIGR